MSTHGNFGSTAIRRVIMPADEDELDDMHNYQDIRMELLATGHNLTSVLINPRESVLEDLFDEFAAEQSAPLEYDSPLAAASSQGGIFGYSSHSGTIYNRSTHASGNTSSSHSQHSKHMKTGSTSGRYSSNGTLISSTTLYTTTPAEDQQLNELVLHLRKIFARYQSIHGTEHLTADRYSKTGRVGNTVSGQNKSSHNMSIMNLKARSNSIDSYDGSSNPAHTSKSKSNKLAGDELRNCYREVPELFFRSDFSLLSPEIFNETLLIKDTAAEGTPGNGTLHKKHAVVQRSARTYSTEDVMEVMQRQGLDGRSHDVLSYYLDLVEVALLRQIWLRSPAFFRALDDIKGLQFQVSEATKVVCAARNQLQNANISATMDPQRIPQLSRRQRNETLLQEKLVSMQRVVQGRVAIIALLDVEDYFSAMELIAAAKKVYHEQLSGIVSLRQLGRQLDDIDNLVCEVMCNKFVSMAIQWEDPSTTSVSASAPLPSSGGTLDSLGMYEELEIYSSPSSTLGEGAGIASIEPKLSMEASLKQLLQSLVLTERTQSALNMYKNRLLDAIKLIVRTCVMEYLSYFDPSLAYEEHPFDQHMGGGTDSASGGAADTPFAQKVREMSGENFLSCLSMCFEHVIVSVQKASLFHEFIDRHLTSNIDATGRSADGIAADMSLRENNNTDGLSDSFDNRTTAAVDERNRHSKSIEERMVSEEYRQAQTTMITMSRSCLTAACDLAQRSISQLISLRKEANAKLAPEKMKFMWEISLNFVLSLEQVSESTAYVMRQCLLSQTKSFLEYMHETCKGKLVVTLDNERWVQCDVSADRQTELDRLSSGKAFLPQQQKTSSLTSFASNNSLSGDFPVALRPAIGGLAGSHNNSSANLSGVGVEAASRRNREKDKESRAAVVDGAQFKVVWSVMLLTETILTYLEVASNFSPITADVINKIVELLRLFNSRTRQLVLGAQAIQSAARLKSISAKHLAVTGQSLGLINALLPHIRAALLAQIPPKHQLLLTELDRVAHDLIDHHGQIVAKFVAIVGDFVDVSAARLRSVDWDHFQGLQCEYFEEVQRNVLALHRVLQSILPPAQIQDVFSRIFSLLNRKIPSHFEEIMPSTQTGRQRILDEITHLVTAFSRIKQIDASALTDTLEETFRKKYVRDK